MGWIDFTRDLDDQSLCSRLLFWPCQSASACLNAGLNCDVCGVCAVLVCCPCRTFCGWFPTQAEME